MNKTKRLLSLVLAILMLLSLASVLSACKDPQTPPAEEQPGEQPGNPDDSVKPGEAIYSISIKTAGGMAMDGIMVYIYNTDGYIVAKNSTDENGNVSFTLPFSSVEFLATI